MAVAKEAFMEVVTPLPTPKALAPKDLRRILDAAGMVEAWLDACKLYAREGLEQGVFKSEDLGYKLVEGRAPARKWKDEKTASLEREILMRVL